MLGALGTGDFSRVLSWGAQFARVREREKSLRHLVTVQKKRKEDTEKLMLLLCQELNNIPAAKVNVTIFFQNFGKLIRAIYFLITCILLCSSFDFINIDCIDQSVKIFDTLNTNIDCID